MARKAEPKFKIVPTSTGTFVDGKYQLIPEMRLDNVKLPKSFDGILVIPAEVTQLGGFVCLDKTEITEVVLPEGLRHLGIGTFKGCSNLVKINIPYSITKVWDDDTFYGCTSLKELHLHENILFLSGRAFNGLPEGINITIDESNPKFLADGQAILEKDGARIIRLYAKTSSYEIKDGTVTIDCYAFAECKELQSVTIPEGVLTIGEWAFAYCDNLETVVIPNTVKEMKRNAFWECVNLKSIDIPNTLTEISENVFNGCTNLMSVVIPQGVTKIGASAFCRCTSLTNIVIPESVTYISYDAFNGCTGLTSITIPSSVTEIKYSAFSGCTGLQEITVSSENLLEEVELPEGVKVNIAS